MHSFRRLVVLLAFLCAALPAALAQNSSSGTPDQSSSAQQSTGRQSTGLTQGQVTVQERIRQRREQRRAAAIHEAYDHRWEAATDLGYLRFKPGSDLQRLTWYAWDTSLTRYSSERLGYTLDARGYFGHAFVGTNPSSQGNFTRPEISMYNVLAGPVYRFYMQPKYSISGRVMGGWSYGNFSGDINGGSTTDFGLYSDANTFAASASIVGEYNVSPSLAIRLAPEYFFTGFGSTVQASRGFTIGTVFRFGKQ